MTTLEERLGELSAHAAVLTDGERGVLLTAVSVLFKDTKEKRVALQAA